MGRPAPVTPTCLLVATSLLSIYRCPKSFTHYPRRPIRSVQSDSVSLHSQTLKPSFLRPPHTGSCWAFSSLSFALSGQLPAGTKQRLRCETAIIGVFLRGLFQQQYICPVLQMLVLSTSQGRSLSISPRASAETGNRTGFTPARWQQRDPSRRPRGRFRMA